MLDSAVKLMITVRIVLNETHDISSLLFCTDVVKRSKDEVLQTLNVMK